MKKIAIMILGLSTLVLVTGCSEKVKKTEEIKIYKHSTADVYNNMCIKCHGKQAEGIAELGENGKPKGPALNDNEIYELKLSITDIKNGALNLPSSGKHDVMEHNYKVIVQKGMDYDTDSMAKYIFENFHVK